MRMLNENPDLDPYDIPVPNLPSRNPYRPSMDLETAGAQEIINRIGDAYEESLKVRTRTRSPRSCFQQYTECSQRLPMRMILTLHWYMRMKLRRPWYNWPNSPSLRTTQPSDQISIGCGPI